jgi:rod shape-determining protein MreB
MIGTVLGLFSQDLALDLGCSNTRIFAKGEGMVCDEPTLVSVHTDANGQREVIAVGSKALPLVGRTPRAVSTVRPMSGGGVDDAEVTDVLLTHLVRRVHGRQGLIRPRMVVALPHHASETSRRALAMSCTNAGAREVTFVSRPVAAALGASIPVEDPAGHLVIEIGASRTEIAVISLTNIVASAVLEIGGDAFDAAIQRALQVDHRLLIGQPTAERLKLELGAAIAGWRQGSLSVKGRCLNEGVPRAVDISAHEVARALADSVRQIAVAVASVLQATPAELAADVYEAGALLTGGASQLPGLDAALREATGVAMICADDPGSAVVRGVAAAMERPALLKRLAS